MAASYDPQQHTINPSSGTDASDPAIPRAQAECLSAAALAERLDEEINRAGRHGTPLSCLLVSIESPLELASDSRDLSEQALLYAGGALLRELRRFDRVGRPSQGELMVVLPGADGPRGEMVARRVMDRLRAIKVESEDGVRRSLRISVGLAAWREDLSAAQLLAQTRTAARRQREELGGGSDR